MSLQEPNLLIRVSIALSLICIGILLLSACGWTPPNPRDAYLHDEFVLWHTNSGMAPTIVGEGSIYGSPQRVLGRARIFGSRCGEQRTFGLSGTALPGPAPFTIRLYSDPIKLQPDPHLSLVLGGTTHGSSGNVSMLPLAGSMTLENWCGNREVMEIEARPGPALRHRWQRLAEAGSPEPLAAYLTVNQTVADGNGVSWVWGTTSVVHGRCRLVGKIPAHVAATQPLAETSVSTLAGPTFTLTNLPATLNPDPPTEIHTTVHISGGACDGQTFPVTVKSP